MMYPREFINEMNELSKEILGSASRWRKILERGHTKMLTEEASFVDPENEENTIKRLVPVFHLGSKGARMIKHEVKYPTGEELKNILISIKNEKAAQLVKAQEAKDKEDREKLEKAVSQNSGSAVV